MAKAITYGDDTLTPNPNTSTPTLPSVPQKFATTDVGQPILDFIPAKSTLTITKDIAIKWGPNEVLPTHQISADLDSERQLVIDDFQATGNTKGGYAIQSLPVDYKGQNGEGDKYFTDGKIAVIQL